MPRIEDAADKVKEAADAAAKVTTNAATEVRETVKDTGRRDQDTRPLRFGADVRL